MSPSTDEADADVVVLNTCCIRENADNKLYGSSRMAEAVEGRSATAARSWSPGASRRRIAIWSRHKAPYVDVVLGTHNVHRTTELIDQARLHGARSPRSSTKR